ncbi:MAG: hypothetical protein Q8M17_09115 [Actinomycetota bacterium]|nr:hypothetical protein [Actinomycetota bacterium]
MLRRRFMTTLAAGSMAIGALAGCGGQAADQPTASTSPEASMSPETSASPEASASPVTSPLADATVTYAFHDSSVPPPYHRSYVLTVTQDEARIVIDSYGDVLADETAPTPPEVWEQLAASLPTVQGLVVASADPGCTGGTSVELDISGTGAALVDVYADECAGSNGTAVAAIDAWIAPARAIFPATDVLAPEEE